MGDSEGAQLPVHTAAGMGWHGRTCVVGLREKKCNVSGASALGIERNEHFCGEGNKPPGECGQTHGSQEFPGAALRGIHCLLSFS